MSKITTLRPSGHTNVWLIKWTQMWTVFPEKTLCCLKWKVRTAEAEVFVTRRRGSACKCKDHGCSCQIFDWEHCVVCMFRRVRYPWTKRQRWLAVRPQTWQPCPRTTYWWARWTRPQCSPWSGKRYVATTHSTRQRSFLYVILHLREHSFSPPVYQTDHHERDWGQRVEEEVRGEQSGGFGDEVWCFTVFPWTLLHI